MAKKMVINCATCDARNVTEQTLSAYESVAINSAMVIVSPESKELLNRFGVSMNCANVMQLDTDVKLSTVNGHARIDSTDAVPDRKYLMVNGALEIGPDTVPVLERYVGITVNGSLTCPKSVSAALGKIMVNGSTVVYPDGAVVLKRSAVIDKLFALRAKNKLYWAAKRMIMVDPELDAAALAAKGATFSAKEIIMAQSKVESLIGIVDEQAEIIIVPDGTAVILDDVKLSASVVKKYGTKLYIVGKLNVTDCDESVLRKLTYVSVRGNVTVSAELQDMLEEVLTDVSGEVSVPKVVKGLQLTDKISVRISTWMLEREPDGVHVSDCVMVRVDADVPKELIAQRLTISDCAKVVCAPEQEDVLATVCEDVASLGSDDDGVDDLFGMAKNLLDTKVVNAAEYML